jgi:putrescine transport system permease protein
MHRDPARTLGQRLIVAVPFLWLAAFFLLPFAIVLKISLAEATIAQPPYTPVLDLTRGWAGLKDFFSALSLNSYATLAADPLYLVSYGRSLFIAAVSTLLLLLIGYPMAYGMARAPRHLQPLLVTLVILPFWTSFLIRVYAWKTILLPEGLLNTVLMATGLIDSPVLWLDTDKAIFIGIVYSYLPFMVLPLYAVLERMDESLLEAAADLGATPLKSFWSVTLPLSLPGIVAGSLLCFIPIVGEFVIPDLLGGSDSQMIGQTLWVEFYRNGDWPIASAVAVVMLLVLVVPLLLYRRLEARTLERRGAPA